MHQLRTRQNRRPILLRNWARRVHYLPSISGKLFLKLLFIQTKFFRAKSLRWRGRQLSRGWRTQMVINQDIMREIKNSQRNHKKPNKPHDPYKQIPHLSTSRTETPKTHPINISIPRLTDPNTLCAIPSITLFVQTSLHNPNSGTFAMQFTLYFKLILIPLRGRGCLTN